MLVLLLPKILQRGLSPVNASWENGNGRAHGRGMMHPFHSLFMLRLGLFGFFKKKAVVLLGTEQACDDHEEDDHHGRKKHVLGAAFVLDDAVEPPVCLRSDDKSSSSPDNNDDPVEPSVLTLEKNAGLAVVLLQFLDNDVEEEGDTGVPGLAVESKADEEGFVVVVLLPLAFGVEPRRRTKSWGGSVSFLLSFVFFSLLDEYYY
mmetsp:Transcript_27909/g.76815  ORF Transcript_27909/g.76815 Transcript_27909/m.76815 type:complete len:204 (-) Transcript_27909:353-964(-)